VFFGTRCVIACALFRIVVNNCFQKRGDKTMLKFGLFLVLALFSVATVATAENQVDDELKAADAKAKEIKSFSMIDTESKTEKVYKVSAEQAKLLPTGDASKLTEQQQTALKGVIADITKKENLVTEVALAATADEARTACRYWYGGGYYGGYRGYYGGYWGGNYGYYGCSYYPRYNPYYYGGGCYYTGYSYGASWNYSGYYGGFNGGCYWG